MDTITFYVSSDGNDHWSGRLSAPDETNTDGPFATLNRARDAIHYLECRLVVGELRRPVNIFIRSGTYILDEPLVFTPDDSGTASCPITFTAYRDEKPVIKGRIIFQTDHQKCRSVENIYFRGFNFDTISMEVR